MKHLKTFESFSYTSTEVVQEGIFGFGKPKDGEWTKNIEENFKLLKDGKLSKTSLKERFVDYGESFGLGPDPKTGRYKMGQKHAPSVHNYLYEDGKTEDVIEEEFAKIVPLTPDEYRRTHESDLNEWRTAAGLPVKQIHETKPDMRALQAAAGLI